MIEVVPDDASDEPETVVRQALERKDFYKIVSTWAEELGFEQICSQKVLDQIFAEFDQDGDGRISETDLQVQIFNLVAKTFVPQALA